MKILFLLLFTAPLCLADQVITRSGDLLSGRILSDREGYVVVQGDHAVEVIPRGGVLRITRSSADETFRLLPGLPGILVTEDNTRLQGLILADNGQYAVLAVGAQPGDTLMPRIRIVPVNTIKRQTVLHDPAERKVWIASRGLNTGLSRGGRDIAAVFGMALVPGDHLTTYAGGRLEIAAANGSRIALRGNSDLVVRRYDDGKLYAHLKSGGAVALAGSAAVTAGAGMEIGAGPLVVRPAAGTLLGLTAGTGGNGAACRVVRGQAGVYQPAKPDMEVVCEAGNGILAGDEADGPLEYITLQERDGRDIRLQAAGMLRKGVTGDPALFSAPEKKGLSRAFGFLGTRRGRLVFGLGAIAVYGVFYVGSYMIAN